MKIKLFLYWILNILFYTLILSIVTKIFNRSFFIDKGTYGIWFISAGILIYVLNKTLKPLIKGITLPMTAITFGLLYPLTNFIIIKIADLILLEHFNTQNIFVIWVVAFLMGIITILSDKYVIKPIVGGK